MRPRRCSSRPLLLEPLEDRLLLTGVGAAISPAPPPLHQAAPANQPDNDYREHSSSASILPNALSDYDKDAAQPAPAGSANQQHADAKAPVAPSVLPVATVLAPPPRASATEENATEETRESLSHALSNLIGGLSPTGSCPGHPETSCEWCMLPQEAAGKSSPRFISLFRADPMPVPPPHQVMAVPSPRQTEPEQEGLALPQNKSAETIQVAREKPADAVTQESEEIARLTPEASAPPWGLLPVDLRQLEASADAFFSRLANLTEYREVGRFCLDLAPWLVIAAAAAWELALLPRRQAASAVLPCDPLMDSPEVGEE